MSHTESPFTAASAMAVPHEDVSTGLVLTRCERLHAVRGPQQRPERPHRRCSVQARLVLAAHELHKEGLSVRVLFSRRHGALPVRQVSAAVAASSHRCGRRDGDAHAVSRRGIAPLAASELCPAASMRCTARAPALAHSSAPLPGSCPVFSKPVCTAAAAVCPAALQCHAHMPDALCVPAGGPPAAGRRRACCQRR